VEAKNSEAELCSLITRIFDAPGLWQFLNFFVPGGELTAELPQEASLRALSFAAVRQLKMRGLIDWTLFERLMSERPARAAEIQEVRDLFNRDNSFTGATSGSSRAEQAFPPYQDSHERIWSLAPTQTGSDHSLWKRKLTAWRTSLRGDSSMIAFRATEASLVSEVVGSIVAALIDRGFPHDDITKTRVALLELLHNVEMHSHDADRNCALLVEFGFESRHITIQVADRGNGFDWRDTIRRLDVELRHQGREHGLLRASRYGNSLAQRNIHDKGEHIMIWRRERHPVFADPIPLPYRFDFPQEHATCLHRVEYRFDDFVGMASVIRICGEVYYEHEIAWIAQLSGALFDLTLSPLCNVPGESLIFVVFGHHATRSAILSPLQFLLLLIDFRQRRMPNIIIHVKGKAEIEDEQALKALTALYPFVVFSHR